MEITSEPMIPILKNAMLALRTCCKLHYPNCAGCQLVKVVEFGPENLTFCRCDGPPMQWCVTGKEEGDNGEYEQD